jgi:hypothetical protein
MDFGVVVTVNGTHGVYACSIECARHHGYEPTRLRMPQEDNEPCAFCGYDPKDNPDHEED